MKVGLGLPLSSPANMLEWARTADGTSINTLGFGDRLTYDNPEQLMMLSAVAAVTTRVRLLTELLLLPLRNTAWAAKQLATLDQISQGRLTVGIGVGQRPDDFDAAGIDPAGRGRRLNEQIEELSRWWRGEPGKPGCAPIGPLPYQPGGPELMFGGFVPAAIDRVARWGHGFVAGVPNAEAAAYQFAAVQEAWRTAGRTGQPRLVGQLNLALGTSGELQAARDCMGSYYSFMPDPQQVVDSMLTSEEHVASAIEQFGDIGADELIFYCWSTSARTVVRIDDVVRASLD
jgi:alkanesulfonate monooxygenase SsuD/methylene tetrahydromethanopterin reductase-like flavin-dependent oxidoreductase (luciferase family)